MPYIKKELRGTPKELRPETSGELNYILTTFAIDYMNRKGLSYQTINDILGAFDGASKEFYRRVAVPYEDKKIAENGDVYPNQHDTHVEVISSSEPTKPLTWEKSMADDQDGSPIW